MKMIDMLLKQNKNNLVLTLLFLLVAIPDGYAQYEWKAAESLRPGDKILLANGTISVITKAESMVSSHQVYNFGVEHLNNYYISKHGFLVHNTNDDCIITNLKNSIELNKLKLAQSKNVKVQLEEFRKDLKGKSSEKRIATHAKIEELLDKEVTRFEALKYVNETIESVEKSIKKTEAKINEFEKQLKLTVVE